ncbi:MAG: imidazolonepropionase [Phycisphaerae bacterium]|nr:imidazolonepropionase [Phycisphaerae bacterium]MCZ2400694.1 imidazolonepropionase [Phycisphaerae bacterium]
MLIHNIGELAVVPPGPLRGAAMRSVTSMADAAVAIEDGRIAWFGPRRDLPQRDWGPALDAEGGTVIPGLIDCHTHIPFVGSRSHEFVRRIAGETYLSIMQSGGGIRVTTEAVRRATQEQLVAESLPRLGRMLASGVTTCECKSGYGLTPQDELKQLRAIRDLGGGQPIELIPTFLGAHALPAEFEGRADAFIDCISDETLLKTIAGDRLARFCDVFCDRGAFDVAQARRVLERGLRHGLRPKLHADELAQIGATRLAAELGAVSADHLEHVDDGGMAALAAAGTVAVVLPGTSFFLGIPHADARRMIAAGLAVALATDCNPGSSMIESLPLIMNIACCQLRLLPGEALAACTANAAAAIGEAHRLGAIAPGFDADLVVLDVLGIAEWMYTPGRSRVRTVIKRGRVVWP